MDFLGIEDLLEREQRNASESLHQLGESLGLIHYVLAPYDVLSDALGATMKEEKEEERALQAHVCLTLTMLCSQQLIHAVMLVLRTYLSLGLMVTRGAIESCGFACLIAQHAHLGRVWIDAGDSEEAYARYRNKFGVKKAFPEDDGRLRKLYSRYQLASQMSHPSCYAAVGRYDVDSERKEINYGLCEVSPDDPGEPARTFLWVVDTHAEILWTLRERLGHLAQIEEKHWHGLSKALREDLRRQKARWKAVFDAVRARRS